MKKFNISLLVAFAVALAVILILSYGWANAEARLEQVTQRTVTLVDQKDAALIELHKVREEARRFGEYQFYRGIRASGYVIARSQGMPAAQAAEAAIKFAETAVAKDAYSKAWPGDPVEAPKEGNENS